MGHGPAQFRLIRSLSGPKYGYWYTSLTSHESRSTRLQDPFGVKCTLKEPMDENANTSMPSPQAQEEAIKKKYGGMLPKKPPLISKDHERAYFDSADWALGKQGAPVEKPKGPLEALRPKLQPTPQQQVRSRRSIYTAAETEDGDSSTADMNTT
ncbi:hypothetical protein LUZ63_016387 [Rhynchospora breviuscula]|uniref:cAMP-regulated phosphoprotein 19-related protein n=1 Tax=Rhynchospora breviuscula TaxID=2022672 RepID=A0A9P9Z9U0_9POAL|nr:hypothetical protein LUZ63_016387 [Rhynchospora breviuscula]